MKGLKTIVLALSIAGSPAFAQTADGDYDAIRNQLKQIVPDAPQAEIKPSVIEGLYEVSMGPMVIYMSADGKYAFNGSLIDLETRQNLTDLTKAERRREAISEIPVDSMIVYPAEDKEEHFITVFSDIDCPYCHKLHKEIPALNQAGITVRYLAFPRSGVGSPSYQKWVSAWCAKDSAKAMDDAMRGRPLQKQTCPNPVEAHMKQASFFGVNGTPNIILDNGELLPGYVPAKEIIQILNR